MRLSKERLSGSTISSFKVVCRFKIVGNWRGLYTFVKLMDIISHDSLIEGIQCLIQFAFLGHCGEERAPVAMTFLRVIYIGAVVSPPGLLRK